MPTRAALLRRCRAGFQAFSDDHEDVIACVRVLVQRKDVQGQRAFARVVIAARDNSDPGHRAHARTVLDQLIDKWLPRFEGAALVELLCGLDFDPLQADGFDALFVSAFKRAERGSARLMGRLVARLVEHALEVRRHGADGALMLRLLKRLYARPSLARHRAALGRARDALATADDVGAHLGSTDAAVAIAALERVGRDLGFYDTAQAHHFTSTVLHTHLATVSFDCLDGLLRRAFAETRIARYPEVWVGRSLFFLFAKDAPRAQRWVMAFVDELGDRKFLGQCVTWAIRDAPRGHDAAEQIAKDTLALLEGKNVDEERAAEKLAQARSALEGRISWALGERAFADAVTLAHDGLALIDRETLGNIVLYAQLRAPLQAGDFDTGVRIAAFLFDLVERVRGAEPASAVLSAHTLMDLTSLALVAAAERPTQDALFTSRVVQLASSLVAAQGPSTEPGAHLVAYNLCCFHAMHGEKRAMLPLIKTALSLGQRREVFLTDSSFRAFVDDVDFRAALA